MSIGIWQIVIIVALILIFFGRGKISAFMKDLGKGVTSFKSGMKEGEAEGQSTKAVEKKPAAKKAAKKKSKTSSKK